MYTQPKAVGLVALQFACLLYLIFTTPFDLPIVSIALLGVACALMVWSVIAMTRSALRVMPLPAKKATLVTSGPYRLVRHPMYTSLLIGSLGLVMPTLLWDRVAAWALLAFVLVLKMNFEEALLTRKFPEYAAYQQRTWRLLPYVF